MNQVPSSTDAPRFPSIVGSETFTIVVSASWRTAASITAETTTTRRNPYSGVIPAWLAESK